MNLRERVVIVTGASSGIGEATALLCAAKGATVVLAARSAAPLEALAQRIGAGGGLAHPLPTDVADENQVQQLVATTLSRFGQVDALVNNAGFGVLGPLPQASLADLEAMMAVNLYGAVRCTQAVLPHMARQGRGQIVNVASLAGLLATHNFASYGATKFALVGLTRSLQLDLRRARSPVRCALVCPGVVKTPFLHKADERNYGRVTRLLPWLTAEDVARAIVRAIERNSHGEIVLPAIARPGLAFAAIFPGLAKAMIQWLG
jgi:hypothetical protein